MVTVSIVLHKTPRQQLQKAIACLGVSSIKKLYLLDNSDTPIDYSDLIAEKPWIEYRRIVNRGYGHGHNIAIREVVEKYPEGYHLVMNADVWWDGNPIADLEKYMDENPEVGMVMPKVFYPDGRLQYTCRMLPTPWDLLCKLSGGEKWNPKRIGRFLLKHHDHGKAINCPYLLGSFLFFRNTSLKDCGFFDERFFMYPEDIDITRRLHERWKTMYWPKVSIVHEHQAGSKKNLKLFWIHASNMVKYFNKWGWIIDRKREHYNKTLLNSVVKAT